MESWTPLTIFYISCALSAATNVGATLLTERPLTARTIIGTILFHGPMGGGFAIGLYESFSWARKPAVAIFFAIAYGGGVVTIPDLRSTALRILGNDKP